MAYLQLLYVEYFTNINILLILSRTDFQSPSSAIGFHFPKTRLNKLKEQKSIGDTSGDFAGISQNYVHFTPLSLSAKQAAGDLDQRLRGFVHMKLNFINVRFI